MGLQVRVAVLADHCQHASMDAQPILLYSLCALHRVKKNAEHLHLPLHLQECVVGKIVKLCQHAYHQMHAATMRTAATVAVACGVQDQLCFWCRHDGLEDSQPLLN